MNIGILTSGGDAPGMNAFLSNFSKQCVLEKFSLFAFKFGFQGLIDNDIVRLTDKELINIGHLGGSYIKSFRSSEFETKAGFLKALSNLKSNNIDVLITLGGDGTLKGATKLAEAGINIVFVPATIDNDVPYTDLSLGFSSAVYAAVDCIDKIKQTMLSLNRIFICEVMGRKCPDIAEYCSLATNAAVLIKSEKDLNEAKILKKVQQSLDAGEESPLIVIRENITDIQKLAQTIQNKLDIETRASCIGYLQRGATASVQDRIFAKELTSLAVDCIKSKKVNVALASNDSKLSTMPLQKALTYKSKKSKTIMKI